MFWVFHASGLRRERAAAGAVAFCAGPTGLLGVSTTQVWDVSAQLLGRSMSLRRPIRCSGCSTAQVWDVSAQLLGLAGSVGLLRAIEATGKPENVLGVWAVVQVSRPWARLNL